MIRLPFSKNKKVTEKKELSLSDINGWEDLVSIAGGVNGIAVNDKTLLTMTATWSAIRLISETIATLPLKIYDGQGSGRTTATDHPLHSLLREMPNQFMTSTEALESICVGLTVYGQAYFNVERFNGRVVALMPIPKSNVRVEVKAGGKDVRYHVTNSGKTEERQRGDIVPIRGFGSGLEGYAPYKYARNSLSMSVAAESYGANFFASGARPTGVLMVDNVLSKEQRTNIREEFGDVLSGSDSSKRLLVLEAMMKYQQVTSPNNEAQFIESRKFQVAEVARTYRVPLHMLFEMDRATFNNSYNENNHFLTYTLRPYLVRIEQALNSTILTPAERRRYKIEFDVRALLRGSPQERAQYYKDMRIAGAMTQNEIRELENLPNMDGADDLHVPLNMAPSNMLTEILTGGEDNADSN